MSDPIGTRATERRLDAIRDEAARLGRVETRGVRPPGAPFPIAAAATGYYGLPLLKKPTWTWEIPLYFFTGGAAGAAAVIAAAAAVSGEDALAHDARWIAAAGGALSAPLLISDLGRPERFLAMLRVFKHRSPMSVGAWTLTVFSGSAAAALAADLLRSRIGPNPVTRGIAVTAGAVSAATGLIMSTYTGVLIGATSIPVWSHEVKLLPAHFAASAAASAVATLELLGHRSPALETLGAAAAIVETAIGAMIEIDSDPAVEPLKRNASGALTRAGGLLSGPIPLLLRLIGSKRTRRAAAAASLVGSILTRYAWLAAGQVSSQDPRIPLNLPRTQMSS